MRININFSLYVSTSCIECFDYPTESRWICFNIQCASACPVSKKRNVSTKWYICVCVQNEKQQQQQQYQQPFHIIINTNWLSSAKRYCSNIYSCYLSFFICTQMHKHKHIHLKLSLVMRNPLFIAKLIQISECVCVSVLM